MKDYLTIQTNAHTTRIYYKDIIYCEYYQHYKKHLYRITKLHTPTNSYLLRTKISSVYKQLDHPNFIVPHKAFIVNMERIKKITHKNLLLENDITIPLSQKRASNIRKYYKQFHTKKKTF